jgi:hypothetical protein
MGSLKEPATPIRTGLLPLDGQATSNPTTASGIAVRSANSLTSSNNAKTDSPIEGRRSGPACGPVGAVTCGRRRWRN